MTRAESIFQAAADLPPGDRETLLAERCGSDAELRAMVERLLARHDEGMGSFLEPDVSPTRIETKEEEPTSSDSERVGPYVLRDRIGAGGMGEVWRAEQTEPVRRTVALKLIKAGMDSGQVLARFEAERQALALMDHPYIAKVHDAGVTERGRPYFVMEHVPGIPITDYCDQRRLDTKERLELFEKVCEGVQHAHQKAVIHRDIKPTNVLVADVDGKPLPKIIDFGVAKATTRKLTETTMHTALGQIIGTPEYMSPEQADLTSEDVDTRTDVYSLGVTLYELLVGGLPFESDELRKAGLEGILRTLREKDPPRPSTRIATLGRRKTGVAMCRRTEPARLSRQLRGDLDWIVMRALEKDPNRRYASPRELAQDIRRHLDDQPVLAGPPGAAYRSRKFLKRHRIGVGFTATVFLAMAVGFVMVTAQKAQISAAREQAELVTASLQEMLASVDPTKSGRDVTVREMLDETAKTLGERFGHQPLVEASLRHTVGKTYYELGEYDAAEAHLLRAAEIREEQLGQGSPATLEARNDLARTYLEQYRDKEAATLSRETLETSRGALGEDHPETVNSMLVLARAVYLEDRFEEAEAISREALRLGRRVLGKEHPKTLRARELLANILWYQERYDEAEALYRENLEIMRRVLGEDDPRTLAAMSKLAGAWASLGRHEEAETLYLETLERERRVLGDEHPSTKSTMDWLALSYVMQQRYEEAEALLRDVLESLRRTLGEDHQVTNITRHDIASCLALRGRREEAVSMLRAAVDHGYRGKPGRAYLATPPASDRVRRGLWILDDPNLASLHGDPGFEALVEDLRRRNEERPEQAVAAD